MAQSGLLRMTRTFTYLLKTPNCVSPQSCDSHYRTKDRDRLDGLLHESDRAQHAETLIIGPVFSTMDSSTSAER